MPSSVVSVRAALRLFVVALLGCRSVASTQLVVVVDTDLTPADGLFDVHVEVRAPDGPVQRAEDFALAPDGRFAVPLSFGVVPLDGDANRRVRVVAQARDRGGRVLVERSALAGFVADVALLLPLSLPNICRGLRCPVGTTCRGDAPVCVGDAVVTSRLTALPVGAIGREFDASTVLPLVDASTTPPVRAQDVASPGDGAYLPFPDDCGVRGTSTDDGGASPEGARPVAPFSLSRVTSLRPTFAWALPPAADGARITVCADRACAHPYATFDARGTSARAPAALPRRSVIYWRAQALAGATPVGPPGATWYFVTPPVDLGTDTAAGAQVDFDGDGHADLGFIALASTTPPEATILVQHGDAAGLCPITRRSWTFTPLAGALLGVSAAGDVDGDGFGDIVVAMGPRTASTGVVTVRLGSPEGLRGDDAQTLRSTTGQIGFGLVMRMVGDVNRDGYTDVAVTSRGGFDVFLGGAAGLQATPVRRYTIPAGDSVGATLVGGDFNGDGYSDVVVARDGVTPGFWYVAGGPSGPAATMELHTAPMPYGSFIAVTAADVNADGLSDVVYLSGNTAVTTGQTSTLAIFPGRSGLGPSTAAVWSRPLPAGTIYPSPARAADANGDAADDVIVYERASTSAGFIRPDLLVGAAGSTGALTMAPLLPTAGGVRGLLNYVASPGDIDGDGFGDFVLTSGPIDAYGYSGCVAYFGGPGGWSAGVVPLVPLRFGAPGQVANIAAFD